MLLGNVALQKQRRWSEYLEVIENLDADAFFFLSYWHYQVAQVQKQMLSSVKNGEQQKFSKWGHASSSWAWG